MLLQVDWTPELHRRFVQAVEQLGIDKAVPSRILDIMGIDCLTRHNIASHLQVPLASYYTHHVNRPSGGCLSAKASYAWAVVKVRQRTKAQTCTS